MRRVLIAAVFILFPVLAQGATYYVAKTGSNNNTCQQAQTISTAKLTIAAGLNCLSGGDTLIIKAGTYAEAINTGAIPSGTDDAHHTLVQGAFGETVTINGVGSNLDIIEVTNAAYITVDNVHLVATQAYMNF